MATLLPQSLSSRPTRAMTIHGQGDAGDVHGPGEGSRTARKAHRFDAHPARSCRRCSLMQVNREFGTVQLPPRTPARPGGQLCRPPVLGTE